jgi:microsomal dipeptidase-like Zn-dependent dipeptidase
MPTHIPFLDLHAHFPMHTPFPPEPFADPADKWKKAAFDALNNMANYEKGKPRVSLDNWFRDTGNRVTGMGSVLYDPEDELFVNTGVKPRPGAICHVEAQLRNVTDEIQRDGRVQIAYNPNQVEDFLTHQQPFIFHTVEGGFSLGGKPEKVKELASLGVAALVPAHLLYRSVATCENAFPPLIEPLFKEQLDSQPNEGLTSLGYDIVEACFKNKVIVDITHARSDAQRDIFKIADGYPDLPLISSHNAVRRINSATLNLSDEAILRIQKSEGVIGVIFYTEWLRTGTGDDRDDVQLITDVIDAIHTVTKSFENIAIGSDLDGFIDPIKLCSNYSKMSAIVDPIIYRYGRLVGEKILYRNAQRVLHRGWTGISH